MIEGANYCDWLDGWYFRINAPIVYSRWKLHANQCNDCRTIENGHDFPPTQFSEGPAQSTNSLDQALGGSFTFGNKRSVSDFSQFCFGRQTRTDLANLDLILGWNFWNCDTYQISAYLLAVAPTAHHRSQAHRLFSPITDTGKHWELGGGLQGSWEVWNCSDDHSLYLWFDGYATHLFKKCEQRTFDFRKNGCFSRFLLLKEFDACNRFTGNLISAVDFTTRNVDVQIDVQGEALVQLLYRHCGWTAGVGYNVYGRSREKICRVQESRSHIGRCNRINPYIFCETDNDDSESQRCNNRRHFGIAGRSGVSARNHIPGIGLTGTHTLLNATESNATITGRGTVDNAVFLENTATGEVGLDYSSPAEPHTPLSQLVIAQDSEVDGQPAPVYVSTKDLDLRSGASPSYLTHKAFAYVDYSWCECEWIEPFVGIGGEIEFADRCRCCSIDKWGVWFKGGFSY